MSMAHHPRYASLMREYEQLQRARWARALDATQAPHPGEEQSAVYRGDRVTHKMLEQMHACEEGLEDFKRAFPIGAVLTEQALLYAAKEGLDIDWFMDAILPEGEAQDGYQDAEEEIYEAAQRIHGRISRREAYEKPEIAEALARAAWAALPERPAQPKPKKMKTVYTANADGWYVIGTEGHTTDGKVSATQPVERIIARGGGYNTPAEALKTFTAHATGHSRNSAQGFSNGTLADAIMKTGVQIDEHEVEA